MIEILYDRPEIWFNCECGHSLTFKSDGERQTCKCGRAYEFTHRVTEAKGRDAAHDQRA